MGFIGDVRFIGDDIGLTSPKNPVLEKSDSFIILDEAQNTTPEQMKMFLTRIGFNSKTIVTGDITQMDLPDGKKSGLKDVIGVLKNIDDIAFCFLSEKDVVRHRLVQQIIKAY